jgi:pimeloyl-ACP methyl ester carboxylesterase
MKLVMLFLMMVMTTVALRSQDITGQWNGELNVQATQLRLVLHITGSSDGYTSTLDSPDQGAKGIPVTSTTFTDQVLKFQVVNLGIQYTGELKNNIITGTFTQGVGSFPMNLSREIIEKKVVVRAQEPASPYPYYSEEVKFENKNEKIVLAGTLTLPKKDGNFPAVILITGSGPQNRNEELMGHKPFLVLSDYLTRNGIAVLRYDDRGTAESQGSFKTATTVDFASDVESAFTYLQTRKEINSKKIGLIGHSEGGIIAPIVAAKINDIGFIVLLAGSGIPGDQLLLMQRELIDKSNGFSDEKVQNTKSTNKGAYDIVKNSTSPEMLKTELTAYFKRNLPSEKPAGMNDDYLIKTQINLLTTPWMQYFIKYDPSIILQKVKCPVLALNGSNDLQVPAKINLDAIKKGLEKGGNKKVTAIEIPKLNHLFQESETGSLMEYDKIEQTFSPIALNEILNWISMQIR